MTKQHVEHEKARDAMLSTNERQKKYYESHGDDLNKVQIDCASQIWGWARSRMQKFRKEVGIKQAIRTFQIEAMGDLSGKRVLDLGCYDGNSMSLYLANSAHSYLGVDLSDSAIATLQEKVAHIPGAGALAIDFLSPDFKPETFDVVYANGVMHHFENFDAFLAVLRGHLAPLGKVITLDPLETSATIRLMRRLYRPYQKDADWEWPFQQSSFATIEKYFEIELIQGFLGRAKWPIFLTPIVGMQRVVKRLGIAAASYDRRFATQQDRPLWRCMQVAMKLSRPD